MEWVRILAYITGTVDQELLLRNEYFNLTTTYVTLFLQQSGKLKRLGKFNRYQRTNFLTPEEQEISVQYFRQQQ